MSYASFLATKEKRVGILGERVDPSSFHESLFPFQRAVARWAIAKGRAAVFLDTGLGKTRVQLEWARHSGDTRLIVTPLSVARQTIREAAAIDMDAQYVRSQAEVTGPGTWVTNYESDHKFDPSAFDAVVWDESSIVKHSDSKTRQRLCREWAIVPRRLACTATPAPNDVSELTNHSELLGVMPRAEMLAAYFIHDDEGWRLKGHAVEPMWRWVSTWAMSATTPADLGFPADDRYQLPPLRIHEEAVAVAVEQPGQLFATDLGGVGGRAAVRRQTIDARIARAVEVAGRHPEDQWIVWCGLNDESSGVTAAIPGAVELQGSDSPERKADVLEAFQDGKVRVLVTKVSICGFGVNLQNCHRMAFLGMGDSYEAYYQAIRRCYRFGQTEPVDVHIVVSELERQIVANVRRKERADRSRISHLVRYSREELARAG